MQISYGHADFEKIGHDCHLKRVGMFPAGQRFECTPFFVLYKIYKIVFIPGPHVQSKHPIFNAEFKMHTD